MMSDRQTEAPEHTAVRVSLWRALHVEIDPKPHILTDDIGAKLVGEKDWRRRPDMSPEFSKNMRASIVGRGRFIEDIVEEEVQKGVGQYVILGAGLDTFAQRRPDILSRLRVFEIDQPGPQRWKQKRLAELGLEVPGRQHFVPVDFETGEPWWDTLAAAGFQREKPAVVVSAGVSMYLTEEANRATLRQIATWAPGSTLLMTFMLSLDLLAPQERTSLAFVMKKAREAGTPFLSLFSPPEILALAKEAGFEKANVVSSQTLHQRYFAHRADGLHAGQAEAFLVATPPQEGTP